MRIALKPSLVLLTVSFVVPILSVSAERPVSIRVDLTKTVGIYTPIYSWFGYDEANYTSMRNGAALLGELHDLSPVPVYVRFHHC